MNCGIIFHLTFFINPSVAEVGFVVSTEPIGTFYDDKKAKIISVLLQPAGGIPVVENQNGGRHDD